jgi:hypothetical protein
VSQDLLEALAHDAIAAADGFVANFLFQSFSYWDGGLSSGGTGVQGQAF